MSIKEMEHPNYMNLTDRPSYKFHTRLVDRINKLDDSLPSYHNDRANLIRPFYGRHSQLVDIENNASSRQEADSQAEALIKTWDEQDG